MSTMTMEGQHAHLFGGKVPYSVGCVDDPGASKLRIVHISDTHMEHSKYVRQIPEGDILIHSGDFGQLKLGRLIFRQSDYVAELDEVVKFFSKLPHKYKIFVAGNHETNLDRHSVLETQCRLEPHGIIYLQDSSVIIEGIKVYGTPWNGIRRESYARGFSVPYEHLPECWKKIPDDIDILITHQPALKLLDFGRLRKGSGKEYYCEHCDTSHGNGFFHLGCADLRIQILHRIRPKLHCFGHVHEDHGIIKEDSTVFSNAALKLQSDPYPNILEYYHNNPSQTNLVPANHNLHERKSCVIQ